MNAVHVKSGYSIFCFLPIVPCAVPRFIYFTSFKHYSEDRIFNFLLIFSIELISLVSNVFTNKNKSNFHSNSENQEVCALNLIHIKIPCVMQKMVAYWIWKLPWALTFPFHGKVPCVSINPYRAAVTVQHVLVFLNIMSQKPALMPCKRYLLEIRNDSLLLTRVQTSWWRWAR